jgi:hypothetical protein
VVTNFLFIWCRSHCLQARIIQTRWRAFLKAREEARRRKELEEARRKLTAVFKKLFGEGGPHR